MGRCGAHATSTCSGAASSAALGWQQGHQKLASLHEQEQAQEVAWAHVVLILGTTLPRLRFPCHHNDRQRRPWKAPSTG